MNAVQPSMADDAPPVFEWPVLLALLPGAVSAWSALMATVSLNHVQWSGAMPAALLHLQGSLLAVATGALAAGAGRHLRGWEGRAAPGRARGRIRASLQRWLVGLLATALAGPLALAAVLGWQAASARPVLGCLAVLLASAAAGLCLVQGWQGRLPRWLALAAAVGLLGLLLMPGAVRLVNGNAPLAAMTIASAAWGLWRAAVAPQALTACGAALPKLSLGTRWRWIWVQRGWERVPEFTPYRTMSGWAQRPSKLATLWGTLSTMSQAFIQSRYLYWLDWGQAYGQVLAAAGFGMLLLVVAACARSLLIAPPLNWRRRLAPRGLTVQRWARRMVWGSMLAFGLGFTLLIGLSSLTYSLTSGQPFSGLRCLSVLGDALLASALAAYLRGRDDSGVMGFLRMFATCLAAAAVLAVLPLLGMTPQRGLLWLLIELALSVALGRAAIRVWAKRDLNALAQSWV